MTKFGIITQARMRSTRLPGKVLLEAGGRTLLEWHLERLARSGIPVFLATTLDPACEALERFANRLSVPVFRGDEHDVLGRFYGAACEFGLTHLVRVTSDCPLIDGRLIAQGVRDYLEQSRSGADPDFYLSNTRERTYPRGFDFEIFSLVALEDAFRAATEMFDREHVTPYLWRNAGGRMKVRHLKRPSDASRFRITVDTADDFSLTKVLIEDHKCGDKDAEGIIRVLEEFPRLAAMNTHVPQKAD